MFGLKSALLAAALSLVPSQVDEPQGDYRSRLAVIVDAIGEEASGREEAFTVLVTWARESSFDARIHAGEPHPVWTSDFGRARCLGQLWRSSLVPEWATLAGTGHAATRRCAAATVRVLRAQQRLCRARGERSLAGALALYAGGRSCEPTTQSRKRAATVRRLLSTF